MYLYGASDPAKVYGKQNGSFALVREQWTEKEYINLSYHNE